MSAHEQPVTSEDDRLAQAREAIANARSGVESEFSRTANTWLECFRNKISLIETYLEILRLTALVTPEQLLAAEQQMEVLKEQVDTLVKEYPTKETVPPMETRESLFEQLNVFPEAE